MRKNILFLVLCLYTFAAVAQAPAPAKKPAPKPATPVVAKPKVPTASPHVNPQHTTPVHPAPSVAPVHPQTVPVHKPTVHPTPEPTIVQPAPVHQNSPPTVQPVVKNQPASTTTGSTSNPPTIKRLHYDEFWISGSIGAGAVVSTNIINSGAVLPFRTEFLWQKRHRRLGFGFGKELYLTPEALGRLILGKSQGISKLYFVYEQFIFRNFPINLGFSSHLGFFATGDSIRSQSGTYTKQGGLFGNIGPVVEMGIRPFYLFVRPDIEYQSWSGLHKQIQATVNVGIRLKFLSQEEKARRLAKKTARQQRHKSKK